MKVLYYDERLKELENNYKWNDALYYLEGLYEQNNAIDILNSLVGFSWYYLIEGPIDSRKFEHDKNEDALFIWKKYIDIGSRIAFQNQFFNFISGYTLSLHGFLINSEYEKQGILFMKRCFNMEDNALLKQLALHFLKNEKAKKYIPLMNGRELCKELFNGTSLLEKYFNEIYN